MTPFDTVLFDLDGTLLDSTDLIVESYQHVFETHDLPRQTRREILAGMGLPLRSVFGLLTDDPARIDTWIATYRAHNLKCHDQRVMAYPGVVEMVRTVRSAGYAIGVVTSKAHAGAERGLSLIGLGDMMEAIVGCDDVERPKPDPEPVVRALGLLGRQTSGCLFVGDSLHDMQAGRAAGTATAGAAWGPFDAAHLAPASPDFICRAPRDVLGVLDRATLAHRAKCH